MQNHKIENITAFKPAINQALETCWSALTPEARMEENGGWLLQKEDTFEFVPLRNTLTGTSKAQVLFIADKKDVASKVGGKLFDGWKNYATFHTHPRFSSIASSTDWAFLFRNSPVNFIFAPIENRVAMYCYEGRNSQNDGEKWSVRQFAVHVGIDGKHTVGELIAGQNL